MVNQALRTHQAVNRGLPPNWEMNYDDDELPPLVQYETDSSDNESDNEDNLQWEESNQRKQIYSLLQQKLDVLHQKINVLTSTKMNPAYIQQTMAEIAVVRQQVERFNQQYAKLPCQQQPR